MPQASEPWRIPFNVPWLTGREPEHLRAMGDRPHLSGDGPFTKRCQQLLEEELGVFKVLLTTSCTHALELAAMLLDIGPGDEVVVPAFTFVSTVNAFVVRGAQPVFADIQPETLNIDPDHVRTLVGERTAAIVPVHYAGVGCDMAAIGDIARESAASVVEDAALALFGRVDGRPLGTIGRLAAFSFHETKAFSCGEGGALFINDASLADRAEIIREKGTDRSRFFRGLVDKYTWADIGSSYLPSDILAAYLYAQLEARDQIRTMRTAVWERYRDGLESWAKEHGVQMPAVPVGADPVPTMFHLVFPSETSRQRAIDALKERRILAVFHYLPLHLSPMGERFGGRPGQLPVTEAVSDRLLRLPFYNALRPEEIDEVVEVLTGLRLD